MSEQPKVEEVQEIFGMGDEFKTFIPVNETLAGAPPQPELLKQEIEIGGQKVTIEGKDPQELLHNALAREREYMQAQVLNSPPEQQVHPPQPFQPIPEPTNDELFLALQNFQTDPVGTWRQLTEWGTGVPFEAFQEGIQAAHEIRQARYVESASFDFVARHREDYYQCPENERAMFKFMEAKQLPVTPQNLDYAFSSLKAINALKNPPPKTEKIDNAPSALSDRDSVSRPDPQGQSVNEVIQKSWQMPLDEFERQLKNRPRR